MANTHSVRRRWEDYQQENEALAAMEEFKQGGSRERIMLFPVSLRLSAPSFLCCVGVSKARGEEREAACVVLLEVVRGNLCQCVMLCLL